MEKKQLSSLLISCILIFSIGFTDTGKAIDVSSNDVPISFDLTILPWNEVNQIIPKKSIFTIIDVETGEQFKVQRRAGNKHADVQPLSKKDTIIMKKIYKGKWSWKRRAIIVQAEDQLIAASMHGMPHGAGAIRNGFPGHFCVHFFGSTTHKTGNADISHYLMILKAGGKLEEYIDGADPVELIQIYTTAVNQADEKMKNMTLFSDVHDFVSENNIKVIQIMSKPQHNNEPFYTEIPVDVAIYKNNYKKERKEIYFIMKRDFYENRWYIETIKKEQ